MWYILHLQTLTRPVIRIGRFVVATLAIALVVYLVAMAFCADVLHQIP